MVSWIRSRSDRSLKEVIEMKGIFYPELNATYFDERTVRGGVSLAAPAPFTVLASYTFPSGVWGILKGFGQGTAVAAGFDNLVWSVRVNGSPLQGLGSISDQISSLSRPSLRFQYIASGGKIEIGAANLSTTTAYVAFARILGWYYPGSPTPEGIDFTPVIDAIKTKTKNDLQAPSNLLAAVEYNQIVSETNKEKAKDNRELRRLLLASIGRTLGRQDES